MRQAIKLTQPAYEALLKQLADLDGYLQAVDESHNDPQKREFCRNFVRDYLKRMEDLLPSVKVNEKSKDNVMPVVVIGCRVDLQDGDGKDMSLTLSSPAKQTAEEGGISVFSPVGQALLFKGVQEEVVVEAPGGRFTYQIQAISFGA